MNETYDTNRASYPQLTKLTGTGSNKQISYKYHSLIDDHDIAHFLNTIYFDGNAGNVLKSLFIRIEMLLCLTPDSQFWYSVMILN